MLKLQSNQKSQHHTRIHKPVTANRITQSNYTVSSFFLFKTSPNFRVAILINAIICDFDAPNLHGSSSGLPRNKKIIM